MAAVAQWERRAIGVRTREASPSSGRKVFGSAVRRARCRCVTSIVSAHTAGAGWSEIARKLTAEGTATAHGGARWHPSTVRAVVLANAT
jgi:hypothetical protein